MTAKLPETIKVGWATYTVEEWPETEARDRHRAGECFMHKLVIRVMEGLPDAKRAETLLHEIVHAIADVWNVDNRVFGHAKDPTEEMVCSLAHGLATVVSDNPDLRRFLDEVWPRGQTSA